MFKFSIHSSFACLLLSAAAMAAHPTTQPTLSPGTEPAAVDVSGVETIVILRHAEKPPGGNGNLTPQGFNRAIALSTVLPKKFGKPDYIFAPDPQGKVKDRGGVFNYVRPLVTIEPTAIKLDMPVQTPCGFQEIGKLDDEITKPKYVQSTLFVAWEHVYARLAAVDLMKRFGGDPSQVPAWLGADYDSLYIITITRAKGEPARIKFSLQHEGLDGQSREMPAPAAH
jgi:hypothetical protein